jgi:hypothetical protein
MYTDGRAVQCPNEKCRNDSAYWYQLQIRSADEPMTAFYKVGFVSDPRQLSLTNGSVPSVRKNGENELVFSASHTRSLGAFECMAIYPVFFLRPGSTVPFPNTRLHFAFYFVLNAGRLRTEFMVHRVALCPSHHSTDRLLPRLQIRHAPPPESLSYDSRSLLQNRRRQVFSLWLHDSTTIGCRSAHVKSSLSNYEQDSSTTNQASRDGVQDIGLQRGSFRVCHGTTGRWLIGSLDRTRTELVDTYRVTG